MIVRNGCQPFLISCWERLLDSSCFITYSCSVQSRTLLSPLMPPSSIIHQGASSGGRWNDAEEQILKQVTRSFLDGTLTDCVKGEALTTYIAAYMNCPVSRILNKFLDKPVLKARYLVRGAEFAEDWDALDLDDFTSWHDIALTHEFDSLVQMEYCADSDQDYDTFKAQIGRDDELLRQQLQNVQETTGPCRRRKRRSTPMSIRSSPSLESSGFPSSEASTDSL